MPPEGCRGGTARQVSGWRSDECVCVPYPPPLVTLYAASSDTSAAGGPLASGADGAMPVPRRETREKELRELRDAAMQVWGWEAA